MRCSFKSQWGAFVGLTILLFSFAAALFVVGGILYHEERYAKNTHEENTCEVIDAYFFESRCRSGRGSTSVCFLPVWRVTYSIVEEIRISATIREGRFWTAAAAQNMLHQLVIGMSYPCWCNVIDPSTAIWDEPSTFDGMMLLIGGGIVSILGFVGIFLSYRVRKKL